MGDSVTVSDVNVDGDSATATAKVTGNVFDGQTIKVSLVKDGGSGSSMSSTDSRTSTAMPS